MNTNPYLPLIAAIAQGKVPPVNAAEVDALLHWLAGRDTRAAEQIRQAFRHHDIAPDSAERLTLTYLDATLFVHEADPYRLFGLTPDCDLADIRARHKRLLQIFHPDRHADNQDWFTRRTERLNHAYAYLKKHHGAAASPPVSAPVAAPPQTGRRPRPAGRFSWRDSGRLRHRLKAVLGNPDALQQRVFVVLFAGPVVLLAVLYVTAPDVVEDEGSSMVTDGGKPAPRPEGALEAVAAPGEGGRAGAGADFGGPPPSAPPPYEPSPGTEWVAMVMPEHTPQDTAGQGGTQVPAPVTSELPAHPEVPAAMIGIDHILRLSRASDHELSRHEPEQTADEPLAAAPPKPDAPGNREPDEPGDGTSREQVRTWRNAPAETGSRTAAGTHAAPPGNDRAPAGARPPDDGTTRTAAAGKTPAEPPNDMKALKVLLEQYRAAYNRSNIERFAALFQQDAETKYAKGKSEIKSKYGEFFRKTSERHLVFEDIRIKLLGRRQYKIETRYEVAWKYPDGDSETRSGRFGMHVVPAGDELKIWRLNY